MAMLTRRPEGRRTGRKRGDFGPSVREVCLLGTARPEAPLTPGAQVEWWGRIYRVEASQPLPGDGPARYVHLSPEAEVGDGR